MSDHFARGSDDIERGVDHFGRAPDVRQGTQFDSERNREGASLALSVGKNRLALRSRGRILVIVASAEAAWKGIPVLDIENFRSYFLDDDGRSIPGVSTEDAADILSEVTDIDVSAWQVRRVLTERGDVFRIGNTIVVTLDDMPELAGLLGLDVEDDDEDDDDADQSDPDLAAEEDDDVS